MSRPDRLWIAAGLAALLLYWFGGVLPRLDATIGYAGLDLSFYSFPEYVYLANRLRNGELPQWNALHGLPSLAMLQPGALYPARLLLLGLDVATAMHVTTVLHLGLSLVATFALCRVLGAGRFGALVGAAVFTGVHALPALYWPMYLEGGAWLPVAAFALVRLASTGSWAWAVALGFATGVMVLTGAYQHVVYAVYGLAWLAVALAVDPARRGVLLRPAIVPRLALAAAIALVTAAPQALPVLAWSPNTARNGAPLTDVQLDPYPWPRIIFNRMFGTGYDEIIFVGVPVAVVAVLGCLWQRRFGAVLLVGLLTSGVLALGRDTPLFGLFHVLPGFSAFRMPERLVFLVGFFAAVAVALTVDRLARGGRAARVAAVLTAVAVVASLFAPRRIASGLPWTVPRTALSGPPGLMGQLEHHTAGGRTAFAGLGAEDGISAKQAGLHGVRNLEDYNPLSSLRVAAYLNAVLGKPAPPLDDPYPFAGFVDMGERLVHPALLDMAAVRTVLVRSSVPMPERTPPFRRLGRNGPWVLYENPHALPRAFTVPRARVVADDAAALALVQSSEFDPRREAVLVGVPDDPDAALLRAASGGAVREAVVVDDRPEHVAVAVRTDVPAVLVLTDAFAPGWTATIDGRPAPVRVANHLARGVVVPAGASRVAFAYRAPGLRAGIVVFLAGWGALAAVAAGRALERRRRT